MTNIFELSSRILELNIVKADTFRRIGNFTAASSLIFLLIVSVLVPVNITFSSQTAEEEQFPQSIIAASSTDTTPHALELKAVQDGDNAEPRKVSGFRLDMTNVVAAQINSQILVFVTDSSVRVIEAKVRTVSDQLIDLVPSSQANAFSLANLPVGVYTLDVMTQKGNAKAAYEGILVISQQSTTVINETTRNVINQEINQNTRVDIDDDDDDDDDNGRDEDGTPDHDCRANQTPIIVDGEEVCRDDLDEDERDGDDGNRGDEVCIYPGGCEWDVDSEDGEGSENEDPQNESGDGGDEENTEREE